MKTIIMLLMFAGYINASIYLTNGIEPKDITFFGDVTGDGVSDVIMHHDCYIGTYSNFQNYKTITTEVYKNGFNLHRIFGDRFAGSTAFGMYDSTFLSNCIFTTDNHLSPLKNTGNDINDDYYHDIAISDNGIVKVAFGFGANDTMPFCTGYTHPNNVIDQNGLLISTTNVSDIYILDIDFDGGFEAVLNIIDMNSNENNGIVYDIITPTNWVFSCLSRKIQCFGDWDDDGLEDFMYYDGEVILTIPESFSISFLILSLIIIKYRR